MLNKDCMSHRNRLRQTEIYTDRQEDKNGRSGDCGDRVSLSVRVLKWPVHADVIKTNDITTSALAVDTNTHIG